MCFSMGCTRPLFPVSGAANTIVALESGIFLFGLETNCVSLGL
jgi:hypothetical protein